MGAAIKQIYRQTGLFLAVAIATFFGTSPASAVDLNVGGNYTYPIQMSTGYEGGGSIEISYLNGNQLKFLYCIDLFTTINVPGDYNNTVLTNNGIVKTINGGILPVSNADRVAYLLNKYGVGAHDNAPGPIGFPTPGEQAYALQAAIWHLVWGPTVNLIGGTANEFALYNTMLADLGTAPLNTVMWFSPSITGVNDRFGNPIYFQALVTDAPEPGTYLILGSFMVIGTLCFMRQKRKYA